MAERDGRNEWERNDDEPTPDQDGVDAAGRANGVSEIDDGALTPSAEIADARDRRRAFAEEPEPTEE